MDSIIENRAASSEPKASLASERQPGDWLYLASALALFAFCFFLAGPWGDFPINDDMIYGTAVRSLVETGVTKILVTNAFNFIPLHLGAAVCSLVGFSYDHLRLLTFGFALFGTIPMYLSLRELGSKPLDSALFTAISMLSPFILNLTSTFMSDIPALAFTNWFLFFCLRAIKSQQHKNWYIGLAFLVCAIVTRQNFLAFLPAVLLCAVPSFPRLQSRVAFALFAVTVPAAAYLVMQSWLKSCLIRTVCLENYTNGVMPSLLNLLSPLTFVFTLSEFFAVLGLLALPLTVPLLLLLAQKIEGLSRQRVLISAFVSLALTVIPLSVLLFVHGHSFPFFQNLFSPPYVGTYQIIGAEQIWPVKHLKTLAYVSIAAAFMLAFSVSYFALALFAAKRTPNQNDSVTSSKECKQGNFLAAVFLFGTLATLVQLSIIGLDRYVTVVWFPLCLSVAWLNQQLASSRLVRAVSALLLVASAVYSVLCLNDTMNLNRAQWDALRFLEQKGVDPLLVDGGQEYNFEHGGNDCISGADLKTRKWPESRRGGPERAKLRWWPVNRDYYIISCSPIKGYRTIAEFRCWNTLRWRSRSVLVLQSELPLDSP